MPTNPAGSTVCIGRIRFTSVAFSGKSQTGTKYRVGISTILPELIVVSVLINKTCVPTKSGHGCGLSSKQDPSKGHISFNVHGGALSAYVNDIRSKCRLGFGMIINIMWIFITSQPRTS